MKVDLTEREWLQGDELWRMLHHALDTREFTSRKQLLFCVTVCRLRGGAMPVAYHPLLDDLEGIAERDDLPSLRQATWLGDWLANRRKAGNTSMLADRLDDLNRRAGEVWAHRQTMILSDEDEPIPWHGDPRFEADEAVMYAVMANPFACCFGDGRGDIGHSRPEADLLRELLGNPFRPIMLDPAWQASANQGLAKSIYEDRTFDLLPILGDALEDVGADAAIPEHLRSPGPHVRGCWALDLVLGKM